MRSTLFRNIAALALGSLLIARGAAGQTTLTLSTPDAQVTDTTIGAGSSASIVSNNAKITTRSSVETNAVRRGLLKFDTETTIPAGATITAATLTVYVSGGAGASARSVGVYPVTKSFQEAEATWITRKRGYGWSTAGGDLGARVGSINAPSTSGSALSVDVTAAVRLAMSDPNSRYTRLALIDIGAADSTSYRDFHSSETTTAAYRPRLVVTYGTTTTPSVPTGATLKVLEWNTHYGVGTDGIYNLDRIATRIAAINPDVVALTEVTRRAYYSATDDGIVRYADLLRAKTGRTWYYYYRTDNGASAGVGNAILSKFPIDSTSYCQLSARRVAVRAGIVVNGRTVNVWSTHLDSNTGNSMRLTEVRALLPCVGAFAEQKVLAGDFNAQASSSELALVKASYFDGWAEADADGTAVDYPGNSRYGATRNTRIDYIFYSKLASALELQGAEVFDTRDSRGVMPSDHKPVMLTFTVN